MFISAIAVLAVAAAMQQTAPAVSQTNSALAGHWVANVSRSKINPKYPFRSAALIIVVRSESVSLTDVVLDDKGKEQTHGTVTFETDGQEHPHDELVPGLVVVARWLSPHALETVASKGGQVVHRIRYEAAPDGNTLTAIDPSLDQVIVFERK
jgi:hypothetical protein